MDALGWPRVRYPYAIWDVLAGAGYETAVVGAWERTPVPSDHRLFSATSHRYLEIWPADRHLPLAPGRHIWIDPSLRDRMDACELPPAEIPESEWRAILGDEIDMKTFLEAPYDGETTPIAQRLARTRSVFASDRLRMRMAEVLAEELPQPYFLFLYVRGIDVVQHCFLHHYRGEVPEAERGYDEIITRYHRQVDAWLGEVRSWMNEDDILLVLSDHGFNIHEHQEHQYKTGFHDYAPDGIFMANVRRETTAPPGAHVFDVTPTILSLLRLPVLASMQGRVVPAVAPRTISVTDWRTLTPAIYQRGDPENTDPELIELLKSLGYL
jgi:predicted AlkP superfamily phosphohydrolase/phosphomutase